MVVEVLVELKAKRVAKTFTYNVPKHLTNDAAIGKRVLVSFGHRHLEGFILKIEKKQKEYDYELKDIIEIIDKEPILNDELLKLGNYISKKTLSPLISCYQTMLPTGLKAKQNVIINKKYTKYLKIKDINITITNEKQLEIINKIMKEEKSLKSECNKISVYGVNKLLELGVIYEVKEEVYRLNIDAEIKPKNIVLTKNQSSVVKTVLNSKDFKPFLLHGVTGSGKTEVYMHVIEEVLKQGKEAIVLVPEISLTPQMVNNFKTRFGNNIAIIHSRLSNGERYDEWRKIVKREVSIVIGARSAVFVPFNNIGVIIIDEEHSTTYKQENIPKYNTSDIAIYRGKYHNCPVILGSATPSIESYTRAKMGIYELLELKNRINNNMPQIHLVDMRVENKKGYRILSKILIDKINQTLTRGEQVMLLLNRRGYSTIITCHDCGHTAKCPNCDIPLIYHKTTNNLQCHYCGFISSEKDNCWNCGSKNINQYGLGTQKLEEEVKKIIPNAKTIRMDIDTTVRKGSHEKILRAFQKQEYNVLIGTQMISKGLDFDMVTLVGVLNGDATLNIPDFRSAERTFQLLNQVSGRAGRSDRLGEVIIQAFNLDHYSINYALNNDYIGFYNEEMNIRQFLGYPPFYNLTLVKVYSKNSKLVEEEVNKIFYYLKNKVSTDVTLLGPSPASIPKVNNIYYYQIIIKYKTTKKLMPLLQNINNHYKNNNKIDVEIDINPIRL